MAPWVPRARRAHAHFRTDDFAARCPCPHGRFCVVFLAGTVAGNRFRNMHKNRLPVSDRNNTRIRFGNISCDSCPVPVRNSVNVSIDVPVRNG
ncbi:hypothetical protein PsYK624_169430 [Phanerochaete sordida]|uniref:Uncharacterized protein n=1 Tax=Phanerochaete sordida TaxID=48140 RepID=A0A9P3LMK1_9APHY|nr:hypothetical protein PsYK624_169430 [Phanerochaete sordida]